MILKEHKLLQIDEKFIGRLRERDCDALTNFDGHLMTNGYSVYRAYPKRLRCWAHLLRKAKALADSYYAQASLI